MTEIAIAQNIAKLSERIRTASQKCGRSPGDISLLAVSKTRPAEAVRAAAEAGIKDFGENYLREALDKKQQLSDLTLRWHFIGPIQSNKTRLIAAHFDWVHSVEREKIARRLSEQRPAELPPLQVCLQVNISEEQSKSGVAPAELAALADVIQGFPKVELRGLMAIPAASDDPRQQRQAFAALRTCLLDLQRNHPRLDTLSMGMSADLEAAVAEGSTIVRIGTDLFGPRGG